MRPPAPTSDEQRREEILSQYDVLDTLPEEAFDELTALAARACEAPIAFIALADRQGFWFKSRFGLNVTESGGEIPFCNDTLSKKEVMVVPDACEDDRFRGVPLVTGDLRIRFFAGAPLLTPEGVPVGILGVMDRKPRGLELFQIRALATLARQVVAQMEVRRQARQLVSARAETDRQFEELVQMYRMAPLGLCLLDRDCRYLRINDQMAAINGKPAAAHIGKTIGEILPQLAPALERVHQRVLETGQSVLDMELRGSSAKPGELERVWTASFYPLAGRNGAVQAVAGVLQEITERKRVEDALHREQVFTRAVLDSVPGLLYLYDDQGKLIRWNRRHEEITGFTAQELASKHVMEWFEGDAESAARIASGFKRALSEGYMDAEACLQTRKGPKHFYFTGVRLTIDDKPYVAGIGIDISTHKHLEEQFRQSQKMEAVGQLAGGVAHDFNNLLTVIHGNAALLAEAENLRKNDGVLVGQIIEAADRAATLTRQLLVFGRKQIPQLAARDLNEIVNNMMKMLQRILGEDITLQSVFTPGLPAIRADAGMIEQIILNLAVNARDAMPKGGTLKIATHLETIGEDRARQIPGLEAGAYLCLEVSDTGCGIVPEHLGHIFEPFFTTKEVGKGTGLGLATVYGIVKQHNGGVEVKSAPGKGTVFRIYLPTMTETQEESPVPLSFSRHLAGSETLLVVEDDSSVGLFVKNLLQRFGYNVLVATSGAAAVKAWKEQKKRIQLVLTGMLLPDGMMARELVERFRRDKPELKVIYTSSYSSAEGLGQGAALTGGFHFLQKPYHSSRLVQTVRDCLDEK